VDFAEMLNRHLHRPPPPGPSEWDASPPDAEEVHWDEDVSEDHTSCSASSRDAECSEERDEPEGDEQSDDAPTVQSWPRDDEPPPRTTWTSQDWKDWQDAAGDDDEEDNVFMQLGMSEEAELENLGIYDQGRRELRNLLRALHDLDTMEEDSRHLLLQIYLTNQLLRLLSYLFKYLNKSRTSRGENVANVENEPEAEDNLDVMSMVQTFQMDEWQGLTNEGVAGANITAVDTFLGRLAMQVGDTNQPMHIRAQSMWSLMVHTRALRHGVRVLLELINMLENREVAGGAYLPSDDAERGRVLYPCREQGAVMANVFLQAYNVALDDAWNDPLADDLTVITSCYVVLKDKGTMYKTTYDGAKKQRGMEEEGTGPQEQLLPENSEKGMLYVMFQLVVGRLHISVHRIDWQLQQWLLTLGGPVELYYVRGTNEVDNVYGFVPIELYYVRGTKVDNVYGFVYKHFQYIHVAAEDREEDEVMLVQRLNHMEGERLFECGVSRECICELSHLLDEMAAELPGVDGARDAGWTLRVLHYTLGRVNRANEAVMEVLLQRAEECGVSSMPPENGRAQMRKQWMMHGYIRIYCLKRFVEVLNHYFAVLCQFRHFLMVTQPLLVTLWHKLLLLYYHRGTERLWKQLQKMGRLGPRTWGER
ncbi:unnamed protein product, partial [Symbiodinium sp. CCMP2456]